ncbi:G patch domain-containing protein 4 isoform X2 [Orussus abietinus]|nr:G patch domain-containing protein 4 isoform X2 [Orussus abietinus]
MGHDPGKEFSCNWWESMYNKALNNVSVNSNVDGISVASVKDTSVDIMSKPGLTSGKKDGKYASFLRASVLQDGRLFPESASGEATNEEIENKTPFSNLTDEKLFKICGGRTAHKGARFQLTMKGKLRRIALQDKELLDSMMPNTSKQVSYQDTSGRVSLTNGLSNQNDIPDSLETDDNANAISPALPMIRHVNIKPSKNAIKKQRKSINDLSNRLIATCKIEEGSEEPSPYTTEFTYKKLEKIDRKQSKADKKTENADDDKSAEGKQLLNEFNELQKKKKRVPFSWSSVSEDVLNGDLENDTQDDFQVMTRRKRKRHAKKKHQDADVGTDKPENTPTLIQDAPVKKKLKHAKRRKGNDDTLAKMLNCVNISNELSVNAKSNKEGALDKEDWSTKRKAKNKKNKKKNSKSLRQVTKPVIDNLANKFKAFYFKPSNEVMTKSSIGHLMKNLMAVNLTENVTESKKKCKKRRGSCKKKKQKNKGSLTEKKIDG